MELLICIFYAPTISFSDIYSRKMYIPVHQKACKRNILSTIILRTKCKWKQTYINIQIHKCNIYIKGNTTMKINEKLQYATIFRNKMLK